ncbi:hexose kinase [Lysinimonas soli]|uniref:Hexose kinase n=1 Tax=Lysinimonas soli TaxID=1074233 RepID=A0ABW0NLS8_9MICO
MAQVVVITPNPAIDVTYRVASQTPGLTHRVITATRQPGGKGVNVARALESLGVSTVSLLPLGGETGRWMLDELAALDLAVAAVEVSGETRTTITVTDETTHPTLFAEAGPVVSSDEWRLLTEKLRRLLPDAALLVVSGSMPPEADSAGLIETWVHAARDAGVRVVVDAAGDALLAAARAGADILKPNLSEVLETTGQPTAERGSRLLLDLGAGLVVVSHGSQGITAYRPDGDDAVDAVPGISGNPTGAGDAATAGLAAALIDGRPIHEALRWAAALGAAAVLRPVAGEVDRAAFDRFLHASTLDDGAGT